jgi:hypothetical protein
MSPELTDKEHTIMETLSTVITHAKAALEYESARITERHIALAQIATKLKGFTHPVSISFGHPVEAGERVCVDFNNPSREVAVALLKAIGGRWKKSIQGSSNINYLNTTSFDFVVRLWAATPPETCQIIREEVEVPEFVVPAHKEFKTRLVCKKPTAELAAV